MATNTLGTGSAAMQVSPLGFGCMGLTAFYGMPTPEADAIAVLREAYDLGVRHFDTAQVYQGQDKDGNTLYNEVLVGKFLKSLTDEQRSDVTVATKFFPGRDGNFKWDEENYVQATKDSMKRLGVDCIDLYYFHRVYPAEVCPIEVWMTAAKSLQEKGLIKHIGLSEASASVIRKANQISKITCIQQEWSLFARDLEKSIVPTCKELGIGIIAYSPIGRGFLAGSFSKDEKPKDWRATVPFLEKDNFDKNLLLLQELKDFAAKKGCTVGHLCLAWVMKKGSVPIPGTTKSSHLKDNMGAIDVVDRLTDDDMEKLGELGNRVSGERGNEAYMKRAFQVHE